MARMRAATVPCPGVHLLKRGEVERSREVERGRERERECVCGYVCFSLLPSTLSLPQPLSLPLNPPATVVPHKTTPVVSALTLGYVFQSRETRDVPKEWPTSTLPAAEWYRSNKCWQSSTMLSVLYASRLQRNKCMCVRVWVGVPA